MVVVVGWEALRFRWSDVGVDLCLEVQLNFDRVGQRGNCRHVSLQAVDDDRVAINKLVAHSDQIDGAVGKSVGRRVAALATPYETDRRRLRANELQEFLKRCRPKQTIKITWAAPLDMMVRLRPGLF